ncbi:hypothetical protein BDV11DRAFT_170158 [Aspergillus similis]
MSNTPWLRAIDAWLSSTSASSTSNIVNPDFGYVEALYQTCSTVLGELWKSKLKYMPRSPQKTTLKNDIAQLRLWIENFEPTCMDTVLEQSGDLKISVVDNLCQIGQILLGILRKGTISPIVRGQEKPTELLAHELEVLIEKGSIVLSSEGISSSSSDESSEDESSLDGYQQSYNSYGRLHSHISCLMDLSPIIERQAYSLQLKSENSKLSLGNPFHVSEGAQPFAMRIRDRFTQAPTFLVERLAKANWERSIRIRQTPNNPYAAQDHEDTRSLSKPYSLFYDSGIGTTNPTRSQYAPTMASHTSFLSTTGEEIKGRLRVPPLPREGENGGSFKCVYCGKLIRLRNRIEWKMHVFSDLQSYICTHPDCKDSLQTFKSRRHWADHGFNEHFSRIQYRCFTCNTTTANESLLLDHFTKTHHIILTGHRFRAAVSEAKEALQIEDFRAYHCALCLQNNWNSRKAYTVHVGQHLEEISLACLPREDNSDTESDFNQSEKDASSLISNPAEKGSGENSNSRQVASLKVIEELLPPPVTSTEADDGSQLAQMQTTQHQQQQHQQQPQHLLGEWLQDSLRSSAQQQQIPKAAISGNGDLLPQNMQRLDMQPRMNTPARYNQLYQQRLLRLRQAMATRLMPRYGPPTQYPPHVAQEYTIGLENAAKSFVQDLIRREHIEFTAAHAQGVQQHQHNTMQNRAGNYDLFEESLLGLGDQDGTGNYDLLEGYFFGPGDH